MNQCKKHEIPFQYRQENLNMGAGADYWKTIEFCPECDKERADAFSSQLKNLKMPVQNTIKTMGEQFDDCAKKHEIEALRKEIKELKAQLKEKTDGTT